MKTQKQRQRERKKKLDPFYYIKAKPSTHGHGGQSYQRSQRAAMLAANRALESKPRNRPYELTGKRRTPQKRGQNRHRGSAQRSELKTLRECKLDHGHSPLLCARPHCRLRHSKCCWEKRGLRRCRGRRHCHQGKRRHSHPRSQEARVSELPPGESHRCTEAPQGALRSAQGQHWQNAMEHAWNPEGSLGFITG